MSAIFDQFPQNQNSSLNTEIIQLKEKKIVLKLVLQAFFPYHIPSMPMEYPCFPAYGGISLIAKE